MGLMKSTSEFKQEVLDIVRSMPLKEILFVPDSYIEGALRAWTEVGEDGKSPAHEEYKSYYHMITSLPNEFWYIDIDLYMFRVARKIVNSVVLTMLDSRFYDNIFSHADMSKDDVEYFSDLLESILDQAEYDLKNNSNLHTVGEFTSSTSKNIKTLKKDLNILRSEAMQYLEGMDAKEDSVVVDGL